MNSTSVAAPATAPDYAAIKGRQRMTWASGDYNQVAAVILLTSEHLVEAIDIEAGEQVLDVAGGSGNASLAAARRFAEVTCTDYVPDLLERAHLRADAEGLPMTFDVADAEALPYADASFDVVLSTFGAMFAPNQEQVARELLRVCRPGGRIGLTNWCPDGFLGEMFRTTGKYVPPPPGLNPVFRWGTEAGLRELFGSGVGELRITRRQHTFRFRSPEHFVDYFRAYYGPTQKAFEALDAERQVQLASDLADVVRSYMRPDKRSAIWDGDYLEVVATRA